jgi:hypothetical protein
MKILSIVVASLVFFSACKDQKKERSDQVKDDTSQTITDTLETTEGSSRIITDDSITVTDEPMADNDVTKPGTPVKWAKLLSGGQSRIEKNSMLTITNQTKFDELWAIAFDNNMAPVKPAVDFTKNSVVALFLGEVTSGGHSIELTSIKTATSESYTISVVHIKPGRGCMSTTVMEYPYFFAKTNKLASDKAEFRTTIKETKCQ